MHPCGKAKRASYFRPRVDARREYLRGRHVLSGCSEERSRRNLLGQVVSCMRCCRAVRHKFLVRAPRPERARPPRLSLRGGLKVQT